LVAHATVAEHAHLPELGNLSHGVKRARTAPSWHDDFATATTAKASDSGTLVLGHAQPSPASVRYANAVTATVIEQEEVYPIEVTAPLILLGSGSSSLLPSSSSSLPPSLSLSVPASSSSAVPSSVIDDECVSILFVETTSAAAFEQAARVREVQGAHTSNTRL
jgi:hypothetical protein